jgi:thiol-disulfide isomerase/thioredoxin
MMLEMRTAAGALGLAVLLLAGVGCAAGQVQPVVSPVLGQPVDLVAPGLDGQLHRVGDGAGQVRIVDFWATWCEPCVEQFALLAGLDQAYRGLGLSIYAVSVDEDRARLAAFLAGRPLPFTVLWDQGGARHADRLGVERLPTTLVVDRAGRVRYLHRGFRGENADLLDREVRGLLREPR